MRLSEKWLCMNQARKRWLTLSPIGQPSQLSPPLQKSCWYGELMLMYCYIHIEYLYMNSIAFETYRGHACVPLILSDFVCRGHIAIPGPIKILVMYITTWRTYDEFFCILLYTYRIHINNSNPPDLPHCYGKHSTGVCASYSRSFCDNGTHYCSPAFSYTNMKCEKVRQMSIFYVYNLRIHITALL